MEKKEAEKMISDIGRPVLAPIAVAQVLSVGGLILSPFAWLWYDINAFGKVAGTFIMLIILCGVAYMLIRKWMAKNILEELEKQEYEEKNKPKMSFDEKLKAKAIEKGFKNN